MFDCAVPVPSRGGQIHGIRVASTNASEAMVSVNLCTDTPHYTKAAMSSLNLDPGDEEYSRTLHRNHVPQNDEKDMLWGGSRRPGSCSAEPSSVWKGW